MGASTVAFAVTAALLLLGGCATPSAPTRVDYPAPVVVAVTPPAALPVPVPPREWRAAGAGLDAAFERSALLTDTFYKNADVLLKQVEKSGAMGVNRGWEAQARKSGDWFIEEQRFADTVIGAGVNRNRADLIDAGITALEWGFAQQRSDGSFPCTDNFLSASYFVAAAAHSIWLLETTGYARNFAARIDLLRPQLERAALWLADAANARSAEAQHNVNSSRYVLTGYALAASGRVVANPALSFAGEVWIQGGINRLDTSGFFPEAGGFDVSFQAEALVYLLRYYDHAATAQMRRDIEAPLRRALAWLESRVSPTGIVQIGGNTRSGKTQERDRTGQIRRVSAVAVSRAFGLARTVLGDSKYEGIARAVASAKQPS
jgi:hypothetical protein